MLKLLVLSSKESLLNFASGSIRLKLIKMGFDELTLSQAVTFEWFKGFKDGQECMEDDRYLD